MTISPVLSLTTLENRVKDPFYSRTEFYALTRKYVSLESGLDSNDGSERSPYRTLAPVQTIAPNTLVVVAPGTYQVPTGGLSMSGTADQPSIIIGYPDKPLPVFDAQPYSISGAAVPTSAADIRVRQIIDVSGSNCIIRHIALKDGFRANVIFRGRRCILRDCVLTGVFEDSIKIASSSTDPTDADWGLIYNNDVSGFASQGIDLVAASNWWFYKNVFHDPQLDPAALRYTANAIGMKKNVTNVIADHNVVYNIPGEAQRGAIVLGGAGAFTSSATACFATDNTINGYNGPAVSIPSGQGCGVVRNSINNCLGGLLLGLDADIRAGDPTLAILPTCSDTQFAGNVLSSVGYRTLIATVADGTGFADL